MTLRPFFALLITVSLLAGNAVAQTNSAPESVDPHAARIANEVSHEIMSPFCPGKTLAMCPSPAAAQVRMKIQDMAESGMDEKQIKDAVIKEHGEEFRIIQPGWSDNIGLLVALGGGLALAVLIVVFISRRRGSTPNESDDDEEPIDEDAEDDPYLAELREQYRD